MEQKTIPCNDLSLQMRKIIKTRYKNLRERSEKFRVKFPDLEPLITKMYDQYIHSPNCPYCGDVIDLFGKYDNSPSIDHIIPLTDGGDSSLSNLILVHTKCNLVKGTMDKTLFLMTIEGVRDRKGQEGVRRYLKTAYKGAHASKITRVENENRENQLRDACPDQCKSISENCNTFDYFRNQLLDTECLKRIFIKLIFGDLKALKRKVILDIKPSSLNYEFKKYFRDNNLMSLLEDGKLLKLKNLDSFPDSISDKIRQLQKNADEIMLNPPVINIPQYSTKTSITVTNIEYFDPYWNIIAFISNRNGEYIPKNYLFPGGIRYKVVMDYPIIDGKAYLKIPHQIVNISEFIKELKLHIKLSNPAMIVVYSPETQYKSIIESNGIRFISPADLSH
ncbi:MAG: CRISPR-associated endonuclease Cas9 [Euryarchaeota archaeon ADurb.Bin294]|nr:MAG: CRISPR-associated endonuclease Cas9 [Euryarchaeota archaeon ADurb.Bin294]